MIHISFFCFSLFLLYYVSPVCSAPYPNEDGIPDSSSSVSSDSAAVQPRKYLSTNPLMEALVSPYSDVPSPTSPTDPVTPTTLVIPPPSSMPTPFAVQQSSQDYPSFAEPSSLFTPTATPKAEPTNANLAENIEEATTTFVPVTSTMFLTGPSATKMFAPTPVQSSSETDTDYDDLVVPTNAPQGKSQVAEDSQRAALIGTLLAIGSILAILGIILCCRFKRCLNHRKRRAQGQEYNSDKQLISEKSPAPSNKSSSSLGIPELPSRNVNVTSPPPFSGNSPEWHFPTSQPEVHFGAVTVLPTPSGSFSEIDLASHENVNSMDESSDAESTITAPRDSRTSAGVASITAQSYATCESSYSSPSVDRSSQPIPSYHLPSLPDSIYLKMSKAPMYPTTRARSRTVDHEICPVISNFSSSKSFPALPTAYLNRFSDDSRVSTKTTRSVESEWDVAQVYGRFSKDTAASVALSTISEDQNSGVEAVEVGGTPCLLVKGRI
ncbi:hypothetical protein C8Q75DRAFT_779166 [Abortiporus biennis]|nr:hypothetical protein C8Q75DRAFT_779166 [Abortiporus biennis]